MNIDSLLKKPIRKFNSSYRAVVTNVNDPQERGRFRVNCPEIYGQHQSPWVEYAGAYGGAIDNGFFFVPDVGSNVFIKFRNGLADLPIYDGASTPKYVPPQLALGKKDKTRDNKGKLKQDVFSKSLGFEEPPDNYNTQYPYNKTIKTKSGHLLEMDDTPGSERVRLFHRSGSEMEYYPDGTKLETVQKDEYNNVKGKSNDVFEDDKLSRFLKNVGITIDGDGSIKIKKSLTIIVEEDISIVSNGEFYVLSKGNANIASEKNISLLGSGEVFLNGSRILNIERG